MNVLMAGPFNQMRPDAELNSRLWSAHLKPLDDTQLGALATLLANGEAAPNGLWFLNWDGRFSQWHRSGITGTQVRTLFNHLDTTLGTGLRLRTLFDGIVQANGAVLPSEVVFRWFEAMMATLTGAQIEALCARLLTTMGLTRPQCRRFLGSLVGRGLSGTQIDTISATILTAKNAIPGTTAEHCTVLGENIGASARTNMEIAAYFTAPNAPLVMNQCVHFVIELGFRYGYALVTTGAAVLDQAITDCNNSIINLFHVLSTAKTEELTAQQILDFLPFLSQTGLAAGVRHTRMATFITQASAAKTAGEVDGRTWGGIATVVQSFITAGRANPPALAAHGAGTTLVVNASAGQSTVACTHERLKYFIRAHTFANCDFTISDRTRDVISFWDAKTVDEMRTEVESIEGQLTALVNQTAGTNAMQVQVVDAYDVGLVYNAPRTFSMLHFHPLPTHGGMTAVRSRLVRAIGNLFPPL